MNISDQYEKGGSIHRPITKERLLEIYENDELSSLESTNVLSKEYSKIAPDQPLIADFSEKYGRILETVGLNIADPLQSYSTHFNKNCQTLGLDPQRPGKSYVFFTRPDLNISPFNATVLSFFDYILKTPIGNLVCEYLQYPDTHEALTAVKLDSNYKTRSKFDPLCTNLCKEVSSPRDLSMDKFETEADFVGRQLQYAMGADGHDSIGEITCNFEDCNGSPMFLKHYLWFNYIHEVCKGTISPRKYYIREREIDYTCSIYLFKLDSDNETILRFGKFTGCFPISVPMNTLSHSRDIKLDEFDDISITYAYNAYEPMNPEILKDFNELNYPLAFTNADLSEWANKYVEKSPAHTLKLKERRNPIQLLDTPLPDRGDSMWAETPVVVGNKLLFL